MTSVIEAGDEVILNTTTAGDQAAPAVTELNDGSYIVTWYGIDPGKNNYAIYAQKFNAEGVAQGTEFRVNTYNSSYQSYPAITTLTDGSYVIAWQSNGQDGASLGIFAQRFAANGDRVGSETQVNSYTTSDQFNAQLAALSDGGYVIAWTSYNQDENGGSGVFAQRYAANGDTVGGEFQVNTMTAVHQESPGVAGLTDGGFVITWHDYQGGSASYDIYAQRYAADGQKVGTGTMISVSFNWRLQYESAITAMPDGGYLITWQSRYQDGDDYGIYSRRYDADGQALTGEVLVNTTTASAQMKSAISVFDSGSYVIVWQTQSYDYMDDGYLYDVYAQVFDADGEKLGDEIKVNATTTTSDNMPDVETLGDDAFIVVWRGKTGVEATFDIHSVTYTLPASNTAPTGTATAVLDDGTEDVAYVVDAIDLLAGFTDADQDVLTITGLTASAGSVVNNNDGSYTITTSANFNGVVTLSYTVTDGEGGEIAAEQTYTVNAFNDAPTFTGAVELPGVIEGDSLFIDRMDLLAVAEDIDSDNLYIENLSVEDGNGNVIGTATPSMGPSGPIGAPYPGYDIELTDPEFNGTVHLVYDVTDGDESVAASVHYNVAGVNDGDPIRVNTYTDGSQAMATIATLDDGGYVITWMSNGQDSPDNDAGVYAQMYNADGTPRGAEFRVNTTTAGQQAWPEITSTSDGGFLITWVGDSVTQDGNTNIFFRRFDADGQALDATDVQADMEAIAGSTLFVKAQVLADGGFVIAWDAYADSISNYVVQARRYEADGTAAGETFQVGETDSDTLYITGITALSGGGFVIVFENFDDEQVLAQTFNAEGLAVSEPTVVAPLGLLADTVALSDGGYVIAWTGLNMEETYPLTLMRFNASGEAMDDIPLETETLGAFNVTLTALPGGAFAVAFARMDDYMLCVEVYDSAGQRVGDLIEIEPVQLYYIFPVWDITTTTDGIVVTWTPDVLGGDPEIISQAFTITLPDYLTGDADNNALDGTGVTAVMTGLGGDDTYTVDSEDDVVSEAADAGTDTVLSSISYTLADHVENLTLTGATEIEGNGNALDNVLTLNSAPSTLRGGAGDDTYIVTGYAGTVVENADEGIDTVITNMSYTLGNNLENLTLTGTNHLSISGNSLNNVIIGNTGHNVLYGYDGNDRLDGGTGSDILSGGEGSDTYVIYTGMEVAFDTGMTGTDTVESAVTYTISSDFENLILTGSADIDGAGNAQNNVLTGNDSDNVLYGQGGDDRLDGGAGSNVLQGGEGSDTYVVRTATDYPIDFGTTGTDVVEAYMTYALGNDIESLVLMGTADINGTGSDTNNSLTGNSGKNRLDGGGGADALAGGNGDDTYVVDHADDAVTETDDNGYDQVLTGLASYTLTAHVEWLTYTGSGNFTGTGNALGNTLVGGNGHDYLNGGGGQDMLRGGGGDDTYVVDHAQTITFEQADSGTDTVLSSVDYELDTHLENLTLTGTAEAATGNDLNNVLTGNSVSNILFGGYGDDTMIGGLGSDVYIVTDAGDRVIEYRDEGNDLIFSAISYSLAGLNSHIEGLSLQWAQGDVDGTGNNLANTIAGNNHNNRLDGGAGIDLLAGFDGNDTYIVDNAADEVYETLNQGTDTVLASVSYTLTAADRHVENLTLTGTANLNATGNNLANVLTGNSGNNTLDGGMGADTLIGGLGNDSYYVQNITDVVTEHKNEGTDTVFASVSYSLVALDRFVENLTLTGSAHLNATGNNLANTLTGNSGDNTINGGAGKDALFGGLGADLFVFDLGSGRDSIRDFSAGQNDRIDISAYTSGIETLSMISQIGPHTVITLSDGNVINVLNTSPVDVLLHIIW